MSRYGAMAMVSIGMPSVLAWFNPQHVADPERGQVDHHPDLAAPVQAVSLYRSRQPLRDLPQTAA